MLILGHRGASAKAPENSAAAMRLAIAQGAAGSEFDVRLTADGVGVCAHDAVLKQGEQARRICDAMWEDLRGAPLDDTGAPPAQLSDIVDALAGYVVMAEAKNHPWDPCYDPAQRIARVLADELPSDAIVACFDPSTLAAVRLLREDLTTAVTTAAAFDAETNLSAAIDGGHGICSVEHGALSAPFVERAHAAGKQVYAWTTDEPERVRELRAMGVDALICDDPARAIAALRDD